MKIISGGQSGVDRGALDFAVQFGIPHGGACPAGRRAEDGRIPPIYNLTETDSAFYDDRTKKNVTDADGTLIIWNGQVESSGTALTIKMAREMGKPLFIIDLAGMSFGSMKDEFNTWIEENRIRILNVAGPRESTIPGIHDRTIELLNEITGV